MTRSGPVEGQAATVQKLLLYGMPLSLFVSGFFFPIGVLLYWFTNNLWTLGQQFFILRKLPPPGSDAAQGQGRRRQAGRSTRRTLAPKPGAKPVRTEAGRPRPPTADRRPTRADGTAATGSTASGDGRRTAAPAGRTPAASRQPPGKAARAAAPAAARPLRPANRASASAADRPGVAATSRRPAGHRPPGSPGRPHRTGRNPRECPAAAHPPTPTADRRRRPDADADQRRRRSSTPPTTP